MSECFLRSYGLGNPLIYYEDKAFGSSLEPNQKSERQRNSTVTINESGLRATTSWVGSQMPRILFLGDSVTYGGSYIDDSQLFSTIVCQRIKGYTCGNAGINGYGVLNMVMRSKVDERLDSAKVVLFTVVPGDFTRGLTSLSHVPFYVGKPSGIFVSTFPAIAEITNHVGYMFGIGKFISKSSDNSKWNAPDHSIDATAYALSQLEAEIDRLRAQGKAVFVFMSPHKGDPEFTGDVATLVDKRLKENQPGFYIRGDFLNQDEYFYDGVHYEVSGHNIVGTKISNHISERLR